MSAFSRGFLLRYRCAFQTPRTAHFFQLRSYQQPRFFSSSTILQAVKNGRASQTIKKALPKGKSSCDPVKAPPPASPKVYQTYASNLAQKSHPTLLYQAPSHTYYMIICYGAAGSCFALSAGAYWADYLLPSRGDLSAWVPAALMVGAFFMASIGGWLLLGPSRLVRSITALPKNVNQVQGVVIKGAAPELQIEIEIKKMFPVPFFPARKIYVKPEEVELSHRFVPVIKKVDIGERKEMQRLERLEKQRLEEHYQRHLLTSPFRRISRGISQASFGFFLMMRRAWTRENMMKVDIRGRIYQVDIAAGWALDGGRALDRLVKIKRQI